MMTSIDFSKTYIRGGRSNWAQPQEEPSPKLKAFTEVREQLSSFALMMSARQVSANQCIQNCIRSVEKLLSPSDCDLSISSQIKIESYLESFNTAVDETSYLTNLETAELKKAFKNEWHKVVEEEWRVIIAESFHPILSISADNKQVEAAQNWTQRYCVGLDYLNQWKGNSALTEGFEAKLQEKILTAADVYLHDALDKKMELVGKQVEKNPKAFAEIMQRVQKKDPTFLSSLEKEYVEFAKYSVDALMRFWPDIDKEKELLNACICLGHTLRKSELSILGHASQDAFAKILKTWKNSQ